MKKNDFLLIFAVLAISILCFFLINKTPGNTAVIIVDGNEYGEYSLLDNQEININGTNTAVIENGEIYMKSASCPDKLCVHQGKISDSSKKIVCLPNKIIIEVRKKSDIDTVVR